MTTLRSLWLAIALPGVCGCIETSRQQTDTAARPDTGDTGDTVTSPDTVEDGVAVDVPPSDVVDALEPDVTRCSRDAECVPAVPVECTSYTCANSVCVSAPLNDGACDDGDACTVGDTCNNGVCRGGAPRTCDQVEQACWDGKVGECDPESGCTGSALRRGTACNDGRGKEPGTCDKGWVIPYDQCDGTGHCLDTSGQVPNAIHPLAGTWFFAVESAPTGRAAGMVRGNLVIDNNGNVQLTSVVATRDALRTQFTGASGRVCTELDGRSTLSFTTFSLIAWADRNAEVMVLHGAEDLDGPGVNDDPERLHGLAIRPSGTPQFAAGTYRIVSTALYKEDTGSGPLMTWQGHLGLTSGCVTDGGSLSTHGGLGDNYTFRSTGSDCFLSHATGHRIDVTLIPTSDDASVAVTWTGGIGPRGDVMLLTRDDARLRYGIILLVRERGTLRSELNGRFAFVSVTNGIATAQDDATQIAPQWRVGTIEYQPNQAVGGTLSSAPGEAVGPGWWFTPTVGSRYAHRAVFGGVVHEHSGWTTMSDRFLMGWRVSPPANLNLPQLLELTPREGSLFLAVQPTEYRVVVPGSGANP